MKLYIEDEYFEDIRSGKKKIEYREAHLTLVNIKTKEIIEKQITDVELIYNFDLPEELQNKPFLKEDEIISFSLGDCTKLKIEKKEAELSQIEYNLKKSKTTIDDNHIFRNRELERKKEVLAELKTLQFISEKNKGELKSETNLT